MRRGVMWGVGGGEEKEEEEEEECSSGSGLCVERASGLHRIFRNFEKSAAAEERCRGEVARDGAKARRSWTPLGIAVNYRYSVTITASALPSHH
ncbi:hypothetical protein L1887_48435 [Cichorium endivia]|nr:hypothetical protein L1887_48435 [Cichorium endivia]